MKIIKNVEEDLSRIGVDGKYPTQIVIDTNDLERLDDNHYLHTSGVVISLSKCNVERLDNSRKTESELTIYIDGMEYKSANFLSLDNYDYYEKNIPCKNNKIGFFLEMVDFVEISNQNGEVFLGEGMNLKKLYPDKEIRVTRNHYQCDDTGAIYGFDCYVPDVGYRVETTNATGSVRFLVHDNYEREVINYINEKYSGMKQTL